LREFFLDFVDLLELAFWEPFRFADEAKEIPLFDKRWFGWICAMVPSFSLSIGATLLSPPYTKLSLFALIFSFIFHTFILKTLAYFLSLVASDKAERHKNKLNMRVELRKFAELSLLVFGFYAPISFYFLGLGETGATPRVGLLLGNFSFFLWNFTRGFSYLYEIRWNDSFKIVAKSFFTTLFFPVLVHLYLIAAVLQALGGDAF